MHSAVPRACELPYRPPGQATHTPAPARLKDPRSQITAVALVEAAGQAQPAVQGPVHVGLATPSVAPYLLQHAATGVCKHVNQQIAPSLSHARAKQLKQEDTHATYLPGGQSVQVPAPAKENCPAGQTVAVLTADPAGQK